MQSTPELPQRLLRVPVRTLARNQLRRLRGHWRHAFRRIPAWTEYGRAPAYADLQQGLLTVLAQTVPQARGIGDRLDLAAAADRVDLTIACWCAPWPGWSGRLGPLPGVVGQAVRLPAQGEGVATVTIEVSAPVAAQTLLDAALAVLDPARALPLVSSPEIVIDGPRSSWLRAGIIEDSLPAPSPPARRWPLRRARGRTWPALPRTDIRLSARPGAEASGYTRYGLRSPDRPERILFDAATANPAGRAYGGHDLPAADLHLRPRDDGGMDWQVHVRHGRSTTLVVAGRAGEPLDGPHRAALLRLGRLALSPVRGGVAEAAAASVIAQLAATGTVLTARDLDPGIRALLASELVAIITAPADPAGADPIRWELRSVAQRRAALRGHALTAAGFIAGGPRALPTVTALLVTRRPQYIARAIRQLAEQTYPHLDVVLCLHGVDLDAGLAAALSALPLPANVVHVPADRNLGQALAEATRAAGGSLVTKIDDDDYYGPEHVWDLVLARLYSGATIVGKTSEFVYIEANDVTLRRRQPSECYADHVAGATMLMSRGDLESLGGWRPVPRSVDRALLDRVLRSGGLVYRTHGLGFVVFRRAKGHTWDPGVSYFLGDTVRQWPGLPPYGEFAAASTVDS